MLKLEFTAPISREVFLANRRDALQCKYGTDELHPTLAGFAKTAERWERGLCTQHIF